MLQAFATDPHTTRGRLYPEQESATRSVYQRDRDRIVHSGAFRKLQYKTQVFVYHEVDYFRTRLTHSLEVAQIARSISRALGLSEDLAEAIALAHDLGHTPFGHAGEEALRDVMAAYGSFDHNEQTFRILTNLEARYANFDGLNLTWETLEGVVKHNGPLLKPRATVLDFCEKFDLEIHSYAGAEAQVASLADDIAYTNHDIDDGLRAGLFTIEEISQVPWVGDIFRDVQKQHGNLVQSRLVHETIRRLIDVMVLDLLVETKSRIRALNPQSAEDVRAAANPVVAFSEKKQASYQHMRTFLFDKMYRHYKVNRMTSKARRVVKDLFVFYMGEPECLPDEWKPLAVSLQGEARARLIADYIAGMTDRYALNEHEKLFQPYSNKAN